MDTQIIVVFCLCADMLKGFEIKVALFVLACSINFLWQVATWVIYYIILDGYVRSDVLKDLYDYDNSEFVNRVLC